MGAAGSVALNDPFPIDQKGRKNLNLLSHITARILATSDIYALSNLSRPGICGDYAVFLKDKITQQLLPFASEFDKQDINQKGESKIYLYQNPNKVFDDPVARKQICSEIATSIMRLATTVVACLASIQYKEQIDRPAIEVIMTRQIVGGVQVGGGKRDVAGWFTAFGYSSAPVPGATNIRLDTNSSYPHFVLSSVGGAGNVTSWIIQVDALSRATFPAVSVGGFRVQIMDPLPIPGVPGGSETIMPIRIYDATKSWIVGVLRGKSLKLLDNQSDNTYDFIEVLYNLFLKAAGKGGELPEKRPEKIKESTLIFQRGPPAIFTTLTPYLSSQGIGFNPALIGYPGAPGAYGVPGMGAYGIPGAGAYGIPAPGAYGIPGPGAYGIPGPGAYGLPGAGVYSSSSAYGIPTQSLRGPAPRGAPLTGAFDIPEAAVASFVTIAKRGFVENSCPAAIRATTLAATIHTDRTVSTNVCIDEFWKRTKLENIYPYATLQLLCAEDITKLGTPDPRNMNQTWIDFIEALRQIYPAVPPGTKTQQIPSIEPTNAYFLNQMGYKMGTLDLCKTGPVVTVQYPAVQDALLKINQTYTAHIAKMWDILNSLVVVIEDPDTKKDLVRLNPALLQGSTKANIEAISKNAMKLIAIHYVEIEKIYTDAVKALQPTSVLVK